MVVDDINSSYVQSLNSLYIVKDANVTSNIYERCFISTVQGLRRITHYTDAEPLFSFKKPHAHVAYRQDNGLSNMYVDVAGENKKTTII